MVSTDPWFIQPHEHVKFAEHFHNLGPVNGMVGGEQAKRFMLQSQLPPPILGQIWFLADTNSDGKLDLKEFSIACKVINLKLHGIEIPKTLPPSLVATLSPPSVSSVTSPPLKPLTPPSQPMMPMVPSQPPAAQQLISGVQSPQIQPLMQASPPMMPTAQPMMPAAQPMMPTAQPMMPAAQPMMPTAQPMMPAAQPMMPTAQPMIPTSQPMMPTSQPMMPTALPMMQPMNSTVQPLLPGISPLPQSQQPLIPLGGSQTQVGMGPITTQPVANLNNSIVTGVGASVPPLVHNQSRGSLTGSLTSPPSGIMSSVQTTMAPLTSVASIQSTVANMQGVVGSMQASIASISGTMENIPQGMMQMSPPAEWAVPQASRLKYTQLFNTTDRAKTGYLSGPQARNIMVQSRLPQPILARIWALADLDSDGNLGCDEFVLAMYLCEMGASGENIPFKLPPELIPPTFRRDSVTSPLSQTSFDDKRKENYERGQAELERRRAALLEVQMKEKAERERKEREEAEKREKMRLDMQKKEQEEIKRKQKDEQEKRDAARKEMERQCQLEWESKRIQELQALRNQEQEKLLALKAKNQQLSIELTSVQTRGRELTQSIVDTRTSVADVKTTIDGMRTTRDTSMQEMSKLKQTLKDLNAKQIALNQEKAHWEAKVKSGDDDSNKFNNMEATLKQLRDKIEGAKKIVETKTQDVENNNGQLSELNDNISKLSEKCEQVYKLWETRKAEYQALNATQMSTSAWDDAPGDSWATPAATADWGSDTTSTLDTAWGTPATGTAVTNASNNNAISDLWDFCDLSSWETNKSNPPPKEKQSKSVWDDPFTIFEKSPPGFACR